MRVKRRQFRSDSYKKGYMDFLLVFDLSFTSIICLE